MRIYLQTRQADTGIIRFIHLILQEDLMGGWSLIRESGRQGSPGTIKREHFTNQEDALEAMTKWRDKNVSRGYNIAFVEGIKGP